MKRNFAIHRLLATFVVAALVLAPLSRPIMAAAAPDASMAMSNPVADEMSMSDMDAAMADDMPCCPSKAPAAADCDKCVFMAGCASVFVAGLVAAGFEYLPVIAATLALERDSDDVAGLGQPPPERPPRVLV